MRSLIDPTKVSAAFKFTREVCTMGICKEKAIEHSAQLLALTPQERNLLCDLVAVEAIEASLPQATLEDYIDASYEAMRCFATDDSILLGLKAHGLSQEKAALVLKAAQALAVIKAL